MFLHVLSCSMKHAIDWSDCKTKDAENETAYRRTFFNSPEFMNVTDRAAGAVALLKRDSRTFTTRLAQTAVGSQPPAIVDMGAGLHALSNHLPPGFAYVPVDSVTRVHNDGHQTLICDLNRRQFPFINAPVAAYAFLGSFEYILDKLGVLHQCRKYEAPIIMQYLVRRTIKTPTIHWVAPLDVRSMQEAADIADFELMVFLENLKKVSLHEAERACVQPCYFLFEPRLQKVGNLRASDENMSPR